MVSDTVASISHNELNSIVGWRIFSRLPLRRSRSCCNLKWSGVPFWIEGADDRIRDGI
jgi:hypothetical protein